MNDPVLLAYALDKGLITKDQWVEEMRAMLRPGPLIARVLAPDPPGGDREPDPRDSPQ